MIARPSLRRPLWTTVTMAVCGMLVVGIHSAFSVSSSGRRMVQVAEERTPQDWVSASPVRLVVGRLRVSAPITDTPMDVRGALLVPHSPGVLGWYSGSALPGSTSGSTVVAARLGDRDRGSAALRPLTRAMVGDEMAVGDGSGTRLRYRITRVAQYTGSNLPLSQIFDAGGPGRLVLIACSGRLSNTGRGYQDNLVVTASAVP